LVFNFIILIFLDLGAHKIKMSYKILCTLCDRSISLFNSKENYKNIRKDKPQELLERWESFINNSVQSMAENKPALVHIYAPSDTDYTAPQVANSQTCNTVKDNSTYCTIYSPNLDKNDIENIISLTDFDLAYTWIELKAKNPIHNPDSLKFFDSINKVVMGVEEYVPNYECIGSTCDGEEIFWNNPDWEKAEKFVNQLKEICSSSGFECIIEDKRNKK